MYLSRIKLNVRKHIDRSLQITPQVVHALVASSVKGNLDCGRELWREEEVNGNEYLLIFSKHKPDFTQISEKLCDKGTEGESMDFTERLNSVENGAVFRFKLTANPTRTISVDVNGVRKDKRVGLEKEEDQKAWLIRQGTQHGFEIQGGQIRVQESGAEDFIKPCGTRVTYISATFIGELKVTDAEKFKAALLSGIGREKAYGCGLLTILPVKAA